MKGVPFKLVFVEWEDACGGNSGWLSRDAVRVDVAYLARSVGWLIAENKDRLIIVSNLVAESEVHEERVSGEMTIPRSLIRRLVVLPPVSDRKQRPKLRTIRTTKRKASVTRKAVTKAVKEIKKENRS